MLELLIFVLYPLGRSDEDDFMAIYATRRSRHDLDKHRTRFTS
jgi:hypothetical protein